MALIQQDLVPGSDDQLLTLDTDTNLQWLHLTATANRSYQEVLADFGGFLGNGFRYATVTEVTGIADFTPPLEGWIGKEVRVNWQWNGDQVPEMARRCLAPRPQQSGTVAFRHYDDGWRVETLYLD